MSQSTPHRLELMQYPNISQEVKAIAPNDTYFVIRVYADGHTENHAFLGRQIRDTCDAIFQFGQAYIVVKSGSKALLFAYNGSVRNQVTSVLQAQMIH